jgi:hypothetical protein
MGTRGPVHSPPPWRRAHLRRSRAPPLLASTDAPSPGAALGRVAVHNGLRKGGGEVIGAGEGDGAGGEFKVDRGSGTGGRAGWAGRACVRGG